MIEQPDIVEYLNRAMAAIERSGSQPTFTVVASVSRYKDMQRLNAMGLKKFKRFCHYRRRAYGCGQRVGLIGNQ